MTAPSGQRVLILDSGRHALPFLRSLRSAGHHVSLACRSRRSTGYFSRYPNRRLQWPNPSEEPERFTAVLLDYLRQHRPDATLALGDVSAGLVALHRSEITRYTGVTVPGKETFGLAADKGRTMAFCAANDIPHPRSVLLDDAGLEDALSSFRFPLITKPTRGVGAVGLTLHHDADELRRFRDERGGSGTPILLQEFIPQEGGMQYQAEAFFDADSRMCACLVIAKPRYFPITGGTSTANVTVRRPDIQATVGRMLEGMRWIGAADVDLIFDPRDGQSKVLEINPRVTAGIKIAFAAGIDFADLHLRLATKRDVPNTDRYREGVVCRNLVMDALWYWYADGPARRGSVPPFFQFTGREVCYQTAAVDDPLTLAGFLLEVGSKYIRPGAWRAKLGQGGKTTR